MVIPARRSNLKRLRSYFGSQSKTGTKYCNVFQALRDGSNCLKPPNGSSGKRVSFSLDLNVLVKPLGAENLTVGTDIYEFCFAK